MDHVGPNLKRDGHIGYANLGRETNRIIEQCFSRPHLDENWWKAFQVGVEKRYSGVRPIRSSRKIGAGEFVKIALVDDRVDRAGKE
jgi:hypothetical protein